MLFDLQSRGRKSVVKIIYTGLAILMGAGFLLFGVGTGLGGGGLFDIFNGGGTSTSAQVSAAEKQALRATRRDPQDAHAWAELTRARYQGAQYDNAQAAFTDAGREKLRSAASAWQAYLKLDPRRPDPNLAGLMATAYSEAGLNQPADAATALEIVTQARPSAASFGQLAVYAYQADQTRKANLAAQKAVELTPKAQRAGVKRRLATIRRQIAQQRVQQAAQNAAGAVPATGG
jgi:tetratricopeptide (TPR) repeat protein